MTPHDLIAAFESLAEAEDGVKRLRELVLQLAVWGRLTDGGTPDGRVAPPKGARPGELHRRPDDFPDEPPLGWKAMPFGEAFVAVLTGPFGTSLKAHEYVAGGIPVINPQNLRYGRIVATEGTCVGPATHGRLASFHLRTNDVVVARRGEMGRCAVVTGAEHGWLCGTGSLVLRPRPEVDPLFVVLYLRSPWTVARLSSDSVGSTMHNLNQRIMTALPFGLPPLAEQHRIVARVDELMALLDRLEAARLGRDEVRRAARDAALAALREAEDADSVAEAWGRVAGAMGTLFRRAEDVGALRQAVWQLAVRGKLVRQDPGDEAASEIVSRMVRDRQRANPRWSRLPEPTDDEALFPAPQGWVVARLDSVCDIAGGVTKGRNIDGREAIEVPYLRVANVQAGRLDLSVVKSIMVPKDELERYRVLPGDVLLTEGGDWDKLGRSAIWGGEVVDCIHQNHVFRARPSSEQIAPRWVSLFTNSADGRTYFQSCSKQTTNLASINMTQLKNTPLPIPPVNEQHRIVARVDVLMALCDDLEARLTTSDDLQSKFASAAVHHLDA